MEHGDFTNVINGLLDPKHIQISKPVWFADSPSLISNSGTVRLDTFSLCLWY